MAMALHFLTGKHKGAEHLLPEEGHLLLGKLAEEAAELCVNDPTAVAQLAIVTLNNGVVGIRSLDSSCPLQVNRKAVDEAVLSEGDRIKLGKAQFMLVVVTRFSPALKNLGLAPTDLVKVVNTPGTKPAEVPAGEAGGRLKSATTTMSGKLSENSMFELVQFLAYSHKTGVLTLMTEGNFGAVSFREGRVTTAAMAACPNLNARRALFRLLRWKHGEFAFNPPTGGEVKEDITEPVDSLLLDAAQERDSLHALEKDLPPATARLSVAKLTKDDLNHLTPPDMLFLGMVRTRGTVQAVIDEHPRADLEAATTLVELIQRKMVIVES